MDHEIRASGLSGGLGAVAVELAGVPDGDLLAGRIDELFRVFPVAGARLRKNGKRYGWVATDDAADRLRWQDCPPGRDEAVFLRTVLRDIMNRDEPWDATAPLRFYLLAGSGHALLVMCWLHPLLDARGADIVLDFLTTHDPERSSAIAQGHTESLVDARLRSLSAWRKVCYFFKAKRHIEAIDRLDSILPSLRDQGPLRWNFRIQRFDSAKTGLISRNAQRSVGLGGKTLYYIGCLMRAIEAVGAEGAGEAYCVPYAFNLRKQRALTPVFGNHVSVLFAQAPKSLVPNRAALFRHLRQQNADVIRNQLDYAFLPLMKLGSWLSPARYGKVLRRQRNGGERSSFWFSDVGEIDMGARDFFGVPIAGMFHLCQVTAPPSLALLVGQANGVLTLTYNYLEPALDSAWIDRLQSAMEAQLLEEAI